MARVICTGGAGFIGSHVVDALIASGHQVTVIDNLSTGKIENLNDKADFINQNINDHILWETLDKAEYVFHLAALARIQPSIDKPLESHLTNVDGTLNVLEYCRTHQAKLIFSSSSSVYEGLELPMREGDTKDPKSPYALQKLHAEQYVQIYGDLFGLRYTILRYFNVFGERQILEGAYAAVVGIFLDQKRNGQKLTITNDGEQRRDFTYVKDVAQANLMAMNWNDDIFNIGSGVNYSIKELASQVGGEVEYIGERKGEARHTLASNTKARKAGWKPTVNIEEWIHAKAIR